MFSFMCQLINKTYLPPFLDGDFVTDHVGGVALGISEIILKYILVEISLIYIILVIYVHGKHVIHVIYVHRIHVYHEQ